MVLDFPNNPPPQIGDTYYAPNNETYFFDGVKWIGGAEYTGVPYGEPGPQGEPGIPGPNYITSALDVDTTQLVNGSVLVFKTNTNKWTATTLLEDQSLEGGEY